MTDKDKLAKSVKELANAFDLLGRAANEGSEALSILVKSYNNCCNFPSCKYKKYSR